MKRILYVNRVIGGRECPVTADLLRAQFGGSGWGISAVPEIADADIGLTEGRYQVALIECRKYSDRQWQQIEGDLARYPQTQWIGLVSPSVLCHQRARRLLTRCFLDFLLLPYEPSALEMVVRDAVGEAERVLRASPLEGEMFQGMVGNSPSMQRVYRLIRKYAAVDAPVLILGESGSGKEMIASAVHNLSPRAGGPFVAVNCGALAPSLAQSELFGHDKGAFTGAHKRRIGRIEAAQSGTILLDEIGDVSLEQQINLLRFLQEHTIERVGSTETIDVNARVIAASHVDLHDAIRKGRFREDLYYRLNVLHLNAPPLRSRGSDVELLAWHVFSEFSKEGGGHVKGFSEAALCTMRQYPWPGNVRELINRVRRAMVVAEGSMITPRDLELDRRVSSRCLETLDEARHRAERGVILASLRHNRRNISGAARQLGVSRPTLYRLLRTHGIQFDEDSDIESKEPERDRAVSD